MQASSSIRIVAHHERDNKECVHFYHPISPSTYDFICYKINTEHFVGVTGKVRLDFVRFKVPNLWERSLVQNHIA